jgi:transposase InsO family protein
LIANLKIERAEQVWVSDITYVGTRDNPMYLALVTDAYSKKIVGYDVSNSLELKVGEAKQLVAQML